MCDGILIPSFFSILMVIKSLNGIIGWQLNISCNIILEKVVLEEGDRLKGEDDDSDDEEDEIEGNFDT